MFSVLILTLNEERNLPACLASVGWCDDIVVLDSGSTDHTPEIARAAGARLYTNRFENFAQQRNHAHRTILFRHPWVFHLDADEAFTPALAEECSGYRGDEPFDGCWVAPKMFFMDRWIPHCTDFPAWQARFVKAVGFEFIEVGHGQREAPHMRMRYLRENYRHDLSAAPESAWMEKHRRYAVAEAREYWSSTQRLPLSALLTADPLTRRRALKQLSHRLPARPLWRLFYQYILRRGFLDGVPGWQYCRRLARYEGMIAQELRALRGSTRA